MERALSEEPSDGPGGAEAPLAADAGAAAAAPRFAAASPAVTLELTTEADAAPLRNLFPLYLHDLAAYEPKPPNRHGILSDDDAVRTWGELMETNAAWWRRPGVLFPYLIRAGGAPAGFDLIATGPYVPTPGIDAVQHEFFVAQAFRGSGVAERAFRLGLERHPGRWEVATWPTAPRALAFWRRALARCAGADLRETLEEDHPWGPRVVWRFEHPPR